MTITVVPVTAAASYAVTLVAAPASVNTGGSATLTATATAQNGAPAVTSYAWDCHGNGTTDFTTAAPTNTQVCAYPTAGTITSKVTVTGGSASGSGTAPVTVTTSVLVATITCTPVASPGATPCNVSLTYGGTTLSVTAITKIDWDWGDGLRDLNSTAVKTHSYASPGTYTVIGSVTATTTDGSKGPVVATKSITVS